MNVSRRFFIGSAMAGLVVLAAPAGHAFQARSRLVLSEREWRRRLNPQQFAVLRQAATERPGSSPLNREQRRGTYHCAGCNQALFRSTTKFESGTGWPSFYAAVSGATRNRREGAGGMARTEVLCSRCDGHLGHVFNDGPRPTGMRYCMNGIALAFRSV